jgi:dTDP-4-amino-4,6-dideoxygalactose transaminase
MHFKKIPRHNVNLTRKEVSKLLDVIFYDNILEGRNIKKFEKKFSRYTGTKYAISTSSGRLAFYLIIKHLGIKEGDEIILPSYTVHIVPNIIRAVGARPVFVDVDENTFNIDPRLIKKKITKKTKAILPTHLFGQPCDMGPIMELAEKYDLLVIEDCCQACGAEYKKMKVGALGDASFFSFAIGKNLTTFGGGMITTNNNELVENIRNEIESYDYPERNRILMKSASSIMVWFLSFPQIFSLTVYPLLYISDLINNTKISEFFDEKEIILKEIPLSYRKRLTNLQATLGIEQLKKLDKVNEKRISNAHLLSDLLNDVKNIKIPFELPNAKHIYLNYAIRVKNKDLVSKRLLKKGIDTKRKYITSCSSMRIFKEFQTHCPISEKLAEETLCLPIHTWLTKDDIFRVAETVEEVVK